MDRENKYKLVMLDLTKTGTLAHAPTTETTLLQAPVGFIYEVVDITFTAGDPAGSGAGTHKLEATWTNGDAAKTIFKIISNFGGSVLIFRNGFQGSASESPAAAADQYDIIHRGPLKVSNTVTIDIKYNNSTDVDQAADRDLFIVVKKYREAI